MQVSTTLKDYRRKIAFLHIDQVTENCDLRRERILDIESGRTSNPTYNSVAKLADAMGLCFVVDLSINTLRRQGGDIHVEDSPMALYGDIENPMDDVKVLLEKALKDRYQPLTKTDVAKTSNIDYAIVNRMMAGKNVRLENVLNILSDFDYTISLESKAYHKKWDQIGKNKKIVENEHNTSIIKSYMERNPSPIKSKRLFAPAIKNSDGNHLLFEKLTKDRKTAAEQGFNPLNGFKIQ